MKKITVRKVKEIREDLDLKKIVVFGVTEDNKQWIGTHGKSTVDSDQAAELGNKLKKVLQWPEEMQNQKPLERICGNCSFLKYPDARGKMYGESCKCMAGPRSVTRDREDRACIYFDPDC